MKEVMDLRKSFLKGGVWMQDIFMSSKGRQRSTWRRDTLVTKRQSAPGSGSPRAECRQRLGEYQGAEGSCMLALLLPFLCCPLTATAGCRMMGQRDSGLE